MKAFKILIFSLISVGSFAQANFGGTAGFYSGNDHAAMFVGGLAEGEITSRLRWEAALNYANRSVVISGHVKFYPIKRINLNAGYFSLNRIFKADAEKPFFINGSGLALGTEVDFKSNFRIGFRYLPNRIERIVPSQVVRVPDSIQDYNVQIYLGYTFRKD